MSKNFDSPIEVGFCGSKPVVAEALLTKSSGNVFTDLGFPADEAQELDKQARQSVAEALPLPATDTRSAKQKMREDWTPDPVEWMKTIRDLLFSLGMKEEMTNWRGRFDGWGAAFEWIKHHVKRSQAITLAPSGQSWEHSFKNFHSQLCKRFDYCHDEKDWYRDQVSLEEHIARLASVPKADQGESRLAVNFYAIVLIETDQIILDEEDGRAQLYETEQDAMIVHEVLSSETKKLTTVKPVILTMQSDWPAAPISDKGGE